MSSRSNAPLHPTGPRGRSMRFSGHLLFTLALFLSLSMGFAEPPNVAGVWHWRGDPDSSTEMVVYQHGDRISGRIRTGDAERYWDFDGTISEEGRLSLRRFVPTSELSDIPGAVLNQLLRSYGVEGKPGFMAAAMTLDYDAAETELRGTYMRLHPHWSTDTLLRVDEVPTEMFVRGMVRAVDLQVNSFGIEPVAGVDADGDPRQYWSIEVEVENAGPNDLTERFSASLLRLNTWADSGDYGEFIGVAYGSTSHPPIRAGEKIVIEWRTDRPTATGNRPNVTDRDVALRVVLDPDNELVEEDEHNNQRELRKVHCDEPGAAEPRPERSTWVEAQLAASADYSEVLDRLSDPGEAVLCYIRLEAQRRARSEPYSVEGSAFLRALEEHFLSDYLADPSASAASSAVAAIGAHQGLPGIGLGAYMHVPQGLRDRYPQVPGDWTWLYPATQFWTIRTDTDRYVGDNISIIPYIDVPFLVGSPVTRLTSDDADAIRGGKNLSNVMHWATGVKYAYLPGNAMQELFIGYEYWHMEGWDIFGEDAINDLIAEEQGRLLGRQLTGVQFRDRAGLVTTLDWTFARARAWVGAMVRHRRADLDGLILSSSPVQSDFWWQRKRSLSPWSGRTIVEQLDGGATVADVVATDGVEHLVQIYQLIYSVEEWEHRHGAMELTDVTTNTLDGDYDDQFRAAPKDFRAVWNWRP